MEHNFAENIDLELKNKDRVSWWLAIHQHLPSDFFNIQNKDFNSSIGVEEKKLIDAWNDGEDEFGFLLLGDTGVGKTFVLQKLCIKVINSCLKFDSSPSGLVSYYPIGILLNDLRKNFGGRTLEECLTRQFLFLDDLGAEYSTDFTKEHIFTILDTRAVKKLPTFITSNLTLEEIKSRYGERISSRIKQLCVIIKLQGKDKRNDIFKERIQTLKQRGK